MGITTAQLATMATIRLKYLGKVEKVSTDNWAFSLHYRATCLIFLVFSILICCNQFFGDPIDCIKGGDVGKKDALLNTYCWIEGTFTLPKALIKSIENDEVAYPGIEQFVSEKDELIEHKYYQWVSLAFFIQACAFYVTRSLWKSWEGGRMEKAMQGLNLCILKKTDKTTKQDYLVDYLYHNQGHHNSYALRFLLCEVFNMIHVILELVFIDAFLGGEFSTYGFEVINFHGQINRADPMSKIFPKMTKCTFHRYGASGDVMKFDNLCLLPLNILNEKCFIFLWFWLMFLAVVSTTAVIYRVGVIAFPRSRYLLLHKFNRLIPEGYFISILNRCSYGDWFILYLLSKNLDPFHYRDVVIQLSAKLEENGSERGDEMDSGKVPEKYENEKEGLESHV